MNFAKCCILAVLAVSFSAMLQAGTPSTTAFTYQGELENNGASADGIFDFEFSLWNAEAGGTRIGSAILLQDVPVNDGLFTVELDFGGVAFDGSLRWLSIRVGPPNGSLTTLNPRQRVAAAPMALYALQSPGGGGGGSLNSAYDFGGPGEGRAILADAGPVDIQGPDGVQSASGFQTPSTLIGRPGGIFDIQARHSFDINGNPPAPSMVGSWILDGNILDSEEKWTYIRVAPDGNSLRRNVGSSLAFTVEFAPNSNPPFTFAQMYLNDTGDLGLGTSDPASRFHIVGGSDATMSGGGYFVIGETDAPNLIMDDNELHARTNGVASRLSLNNDGGNVTVAANAGGAGNFGIGTPDPQTRLQIVGFGDVSPGGGGGLTVGATSSTNIAMDSNEIMARNNGAASTLFLNNDGGDVVIGGALDIGYEIVHASDVDAPFVTAHCPAGKRVLGGGCSQVLSSPLAWSVPDGSTGWKCAYDDHEENWTHNAYAICARVK